MKGIPILSLVVIMIFALALPAQATESARSDMGANGIVLASAAVPPGDIAAFELV